MNLPNRIFFTGIPGSSWSVIGQLFETMLGFNTSDRTLERCYTHESGACHMGAYFGNNMEFPLDLTHDNIDAPWLVPGGCKLIKSHDWSLQLDDIKNAYPDDWILLLYKEETISLKWWLDSGGFDITYPNYSAYQNKDYLLDLMYQQNYCMLEYAKKVNVSWNELSESWVLEAFGQPIPREHTLKFNQVINRDTKLPLVAIIK